jgi:hypothetical protein
VCKSDDMMQTLELFVEEKKKDRSSSSRGRSKSNVRCNHLSPTSDSKRRVDGESVEETSTMEKPPLMTNLGPRSRVMCEHEDEILEN